MAGIFYGVDNLADLSEDQVGVFEQVFMISIALGVSIIGPILSYLALKLQKESEEPKRKSVRQALRKMLIDLRRKLRKSKEVKRKSYSLNKKSFG